MMRAAVLIILAISIWLTAARAHATPAADPQLVFLEPEQIRRMCGAAEPGHLRLGCARETARGVVVAVPDPCPLRAVDVYASVLCAALSSVGATHPNRPARAR